MKYFYIIKVIINGQVVLFISKKLKLLLNLQHSLILIDFQQ